METMRYQETRKSYKGFIIGFFLFIIIGGGVIYLGIREEKTPQVVGKNNEETQSLMNVETTNEESIDITSIDVKVDENKITDTENKKMKANITLPVVTINSEELTDINNKINEEYTSRYTSLKKEMESAENNFTYTVTYNTYDNTVGNKRILSITIYQRVIDDATKDTTTDKVETYNIDLVTKKIISQSDVLFDILGKDYNTLLKNSIKNYVVSNSMISEEDFNYTPTGLENFYIKDSKLHIILNENELVDKKYGVIDITIE